MNALPEKLLAAEHPPPGSVCNADGKSPFLLVADHAGKIMPRALGRLSVPETDCERHIAWDIGIGGLGRLFGDGRDGTLMPQKYSRLVIDCNRPLDAATSIPEISEHTPIPGNKDLSEGARTARACEIFWPYHERIEAELDRRLQTGRAAVLIALHSFAPVFKGAARPWHAGVPSNRAPRLPPRLLAPLTAVKGLFVVA